MTLVTSRSFGEYVASEFATTAVDRLYKPNAARRPVLYFTEGGDDRGFLDTTELGKQIAPAVVEEGIPMVGAYYGGATLWGNATTTTRIGQVWTWVQTALGTKTDKFVGIGVSKGFMALANYTRLNPSNVAALIGIVPAVNVTDIYDNARPLTSPAAIDAAYPSGGWAGNKAARDPALNTATHASQAIPMKLIYGSTDTTTLPALTAAFGAAVGATLQQKVGTDHSTTGPAVDPGNDILPFLEQYV